MPDKRWACVTCSESMTRPEPPRTTAPCWVNVGCHTDAHEQVQWFGDDISFKATKYMDSKSKLDEVARPCCGCSAQERHRCIACGVAFAFALGGHRDVEAMIAQHARLARSLAEELGLEPPVLDALGAVV